MDTTSTSRELNRETSALVAEVQLLSQKIAIEVLRSGYVVTPDPQSSVEAFLNMPVPAQETVVANLKSYLDLVSRLKVAIPGDISTTEDWDHLNAALWKFGLCCDGEVKTHFERGDIIEAYTDEGIQFYRNFNFFKICRYSLLELSTIEWFKLYDRPTAITGQIMGALTKALSSPIKVLPFDGGTYLLREALFKDNRIFHVTNKIIGRLDDASGTPRGVVTTLQASVIGDN